MIDINSREIEVCVGSSVENNRDNVFVSFLVFLIFKVESDKYNIDIDDFYGYFMFLIIL